MKTQLLVIAFVISIAYTEGFSRISRAAKLANKECSGSDCEDEQKLDKVNIAENQKQVQDQSSSPITSSPQLTSPGLLSSTETVISNGQKTNDYIKKDLKYSSDKTETTNKLTSKINIATTISPSQKRNEATVVTSEDRSTQNVLGESNDNDNTENQLVGGFYILKPHKKDTNQVRSEIQLNPLLNKLLPEAPENIPIVFFDFGGQPINRPQDLAENRFELGFQTKPLFSIEPGLMSSDPYNKYSALNSFGYPTHMEVFNQPTIETNMISCLLQLLLQNANPEYKILNGVYPQSEIPYSTAMSQNYNGPIPNEFGLLPDPKTSLSIFWKMISSMSDSMHNRFVEQQPLGNFWNTYFIPSPKPQSQSIPLTPTYSDYLPVNPSQQIFSQSFLPLSTQYQQQYQSNYQPQYQSQYLSQYQPQSQYQWYQPYSMVQVDIPQTKTLLPDMYSSNFPYTIDLYSKNYPLPNYSYDGLPFLTNPQTEFLQWPCTIPSIFQNHQFLFRRRRR